MVILGVLMGILWIEKIKFAHSHSHPEGNKPGPPDETNVTSDQITNELDLSQLEKDDDLEDIFKQELGEKKAKAQVIFQLGELAKDFGFQNTANEATENTDTQSNDTPFSDSSAQKENKESL